MSSILGRSILIRKLHLDAIKFAKTSQLNAKLKGKSKSSQAWLMRQFTDPYVERAKIDNYRCRSAFKLLEIDKRCGVLSPGNVVVDCGAAPGSWSQIAVAKTNSNGDQQNKPTGFVVGIDLQQIYPIPGAHFLGNTDFTEYGTQAKLMHILGGRKVDCVLSDMAPKATGIRCLDQENSINLCYSALRFACQVSQTNGSFLVKVLDNNEVNNFLKNLLKYYKNIKIIKPNASRTESSEKFILAKGFYGLK